MTHKKPRSFDSVFKGTKSKQVLEQEIWSLENASGSIMTETEAKNWFKNYVKSSGEYAARFGLDALREWKKWAKS